jgi:hypothetical protein
MSSRPDDRDEYGPDHNEIIDSHYGAPRRRPHLAALAVVAVIALGAGGGVAYVATHSANGASTDAAAGTAPTPSASPPASTPSWGGRGPGGFGRFGAFGGLGFGGLGFGGLGGVIHGQVTGPKPGGGYQTVDVQRGTVTAVSSSSLTVKSADGFSATYAVSSSTEVNAQAAGIATVKTGDTVEVTATVSGGTATAASIIDATSIGSSRGSFGFPAGPPSPPSTTQN